jgi:hypothetical protein
MILSVPPVLRPRERKVFPNCAHFFPCGCQRARIVSLKGKYKLVYSIAQAFEIDVTSSQLRISIRAQRDF